jgi:hypothetical protein
MGERKLLEANIFADNTGAVYVRKDSTYMRYMNVWQYLENKEAVDAEPYLDPVKSPHLTYSDTAMFTLQGSAVRLWTTMPKAELMVRFPRGEANPRDLIVLSLKSAGDTLASTHTDALVCSLLYRGDDWEKPPPKAGKFTWLLCSRMAGSLGDATRLRHQGNFPVYTPEGAYRPRPQWNQKRTSVAKVLAAAYDDAMRAMNRPTADAKTIFELYAYAAMVKGFATQKLPKAYVGDWSRVFEPKPLNKPSRALAYGPRLTLDALYLMHAARATDTSGNSAALDYVSKGTSNVVFAVGEDAILRVRINGTSGADKDELNIKNALKGQGVLADTIADTIVVVGETKHNATAIERFDGSLMGLGPAYFHKAEHALEDTLLELYTRLSAVARCFDTKEQNVVARKVGRDRFALALIDTEGDWCVVEKRDQHVGPVGLRELEVALKQEPASADTPLLFASLCLLVFHAAETLSRKITRYPRTRRILLDHFETIVRMAKTLNSSASENLRGTLFYYAKTDEDDFDAVKARLHVDLPQSHTPKYDHAQAYWSGGRLIEDLPHLPQKAPQTNSVLATEIARLVSIQYGKVVSARLKAHVALAEERYNAKRGLVGTLHNPEQVARACSVDLLTAQAFLAVVRRTQSLYTELTEPHGADGPVGPVADDGAGALVQAENAGAPAPKERPSCAVSIAALFSD